MHNNLFHKSLAITLAILMFSTSIGFSMDMHFCQGKLKSVSLIGKAKSCHEVDKMPSCPFHSKANTEQKNCCTNKQLLVEQSDEEATTPAASSLELQVVQAVVTPTYTFINTEAISSDYTKYLFYKPPIPKSDRRLLYQTFLI